MGRINTPVAIFLRLFLTPNRAKEVKIEFFVSFAKKVSTEFPVNILKLIGTTFRCV